MTKTASAPPGEASSSGSMRVTAYDKLGGDITIAYDPACFATDHHVVFGPLEQVAAHAWTGQACGLGVSGTATFDPGHGSFFWVVVGSSAGVEGSYGKQSGGVELPPADGLAGCEYTQSLGTVCP
jgi:hypothetical protein